MTTTAQSVTANATPLTQSDVNHFLVAYRNLIDRTVEDERNGAYDKAVQDNYEISRMIQALLTRLAQHPRGAVTINRDTALTLERESLARILRAYTLQSLQNLNFGDLALSVANEKQIQDDLRTVNAQKGASGGGFQSDADVEDENDETIDLRQSDGLYEIVDTENSPNVDDLIGYREEARRFVTLCYRIEDTGSSNFRAAGNAKATKAILLYGPPGSGKTTTAQAVAKTLNLVYVFGKASNIVSVYAGQTQKNLNKLYRRCRMIVRAYGRNVLLLIDELDGLIKNRNDGRLSNEEYNRITTFLQILEPNDNTDNSKIVSVFTTNRLANIDSAVVQRTAQLFLGYIVLPEDREALLRKTFEETIVDPSQFPWKLYGASIAEFVPRDFVRLSGVIYDERFAIQFQRKRVDQVARDSANAGDRSNGLTIRVALTKLDNNAFLRSLKTFLPATLVGAYFEDYDPPREHVTRWLANNSDVEGVPQRVIAAYRQALK